MKSMSFKNRDEMVKGLKSIKVETTTCDGFNFSRRMSLNVVWMH